MQLDFATVLVLVILLVAGYWFLFVRKSDGKVLAGSVTGQELALILGPSGAGKTALFYRLQSGVFRETVSSLKPNSGLIKLGNSTMVDAIDYPGHDKLRHGLSNLIPKATQILFIIDPTDKSQLKAGAEQLFDLLSNNDLNAPIRVCLSKLEKDGQKSVKYLTLELEREIEKMRKSRDGESGRFLGVDGQDFSFTKNHAPVPVSFVTISSKTGELPF